MRRVVNAAYVALVAACVVGIVLPTSPLHSATGLAPAASWRSFNPPVANVVFHGGLVGGAPSRPGIVRDIPVFVVLGRSGGFPRAYTDGTLRFLQELSRSAGSPSNPLEPITTLHDGNGLPLGDSVAFGVPQHFRIQSPTGGGACQPDTGRDVYSDGSGFTSCLLNTYLETTVIDELMQSKLPLGVARIYSVFLPPGIEVCDGSSNAAQGGSCNWGNEPRAFGAYHVGYCTDGQVSCTASTSVLLTVEPYPTGGTAGAPVQVDVDTTATHLIHELAEAITDPLPRQPGWIADDTEDTAGAEVGDVCETVAVPFHLDPDGLRWNVQLGSDRYLSEGLFDARGPSCRP